MSMPKEYPKQYNSIRERFKEYVDALEELGKATKEGPIDEKTIQLIQLAASASIRSEGSVHSHTRRAIEAGANEAEIYYALISITSTVGFPNVAAAISWADDIILKK